MLSSSRIELSEYHQPEVFGASCFKSHGGNYIHEIKKSLNLGSGWHTVPGK